MGGHKSKPIYSVELPNSETNEFSSVFKGPYTDPVVTHETYYHLARDIAERIPSKKMMSQVNFVTGKHRWLTFLQAMKKIEKCANYLGSLDFQEDSEGKIFCGILSRNCAEWFIFDMACCKTGIISVGLVENSSTDYLGEMIKQLELQYLCCDRANLIKLISLNRERKTRISKVFLMEKPDYQELHQAEQAGINLEYFCKKVQTSAVKCRKQEIFTLSLTGGTSGPQKACIITHRAFLSSILGAEIPGLNLETKDVFLSYAPPSVLWERVILYKILVSGASVAYTDINSVEFIDDLKYFKPTLLLGLCKLLEKIYDGIQDKLSQASAGSKSFFKKAYEAKLENYKKSGSLTSFIYDKFVFKKIRGSLGGRIRLMIAGSSVYREGIVEYMKLVLSCEILQGYGSIETMITCMCSMPGDFTSFHLGGPLAGYLFKLRKMRGVEIEGLEGKVFGELYVKSEKLFSGYHNKQGPCFDSDGWYATSDVFVLNKENMSFSFVEKLDNIIALKNGKSICLQKIESIARNCRFIENIYVSVRDNYVLAVIVPNENYVKQNIILNAAQNNIPIADLCQNHFVIQEVFKDLSLVLGRGMVKDYEKIRGIYLEPEPWISELYLGPTLKLKRYNMETRYSEIFHNLLIQVKRQENE